jgi:hypothetical protein
MEVVDDIAKDYRMTHDDISVWHILRGGYGYRSQGAEMRIGKRLGVRSADGKKELDGDYSRGYVSC